MQFGTFSFFERRLAKTVGRLIGLTTSTERCWPTTKTGSQSQPIAIRPRRKLVLEFTTMKFCKFRSMAANAFGAFVTRAVLSTTKRKQPVTGRRRNQQSAVM